LVRRQGKPKPSPKPSPKHSDDAHAFGADDVAASGVMFRKLRFQMIADI
jgi:hypothetical protein